ncbi:MAG: branched-chain amino acid ABC transporter permease [Candidatus Hodarchaeota archaeon]
MVDWKEVVEDFWEDVKDRTYYILGVIILILIPLILAAPASDLPEPFSILNIFYSGSKFPILSDIYAIGREAGLFKPNSTVLQVLALCAIWAIFAASWDLLSGYTGQVSFGHAIFWGLSAYFSYWIASGMTVEPLFRGVFGREVVMDPLVALFLGAIISALAALCIGVVALRVKGPYLALVTLMVPLIVGQLFKLNEDFWLIFFSDLETGLDYGKYPVPDIIPSVANRDIDMLNFYLFVVLILFIAVGLMMLIAFSRLGLAFQSIREDEDAAESLGINVRFYKILAFTVSAFFAGLAGGLYAQWLDQAGPSFFEASFSFSVIIMCVVGGVGSITGGVIGAFLLTILVEIYLGDIFPATEVPAMDLLAYGFVLIFTLRYMRFGLVRAAKDQKRACVIGILFALSWAILDSIIVLDIFKPIDSITDSIQNFQSIRDAESIALGDIISIYPVVIGLLIMFLIALPAIPIFILSEIIGLFVLEGVLGMSLETSALAKAKFLIYAIAGIPYAYYLPKIFKKVRLRFWGIWPSVGRYEPD